MKDGLKAEMLPKKKTNQTCLNVYRVYCYVFAVGDFVIFFDTWILKLLTN